jgi:hypothetical protein
MLLGERMKEDEADETCSMSQCCSVKDKTLCPSRHHSTVAVDSSRAMLSLRHGVTDPYNHLRNWKFSRHVNEVLALLGCYASFIGSWLPTFRDNLPIPIPGARQLGCLTLECGTDSLSLNVGNQLPLKAA